MAEKNKARIPIVAISFTSVFAFLGVCGLFSLNQYPYRIGFAQEANLDKIHFLTSASFIIGVFCGVIALRLACHEASGFIKWGLRVGILLSVTGLATLLCNPHFGVHSVITAKNICINNAREIEAAKVQWAQLGGATNGTKVSWIDVAPYFTNSLPKCPEGGTYDIGKIDQPVTCSLVSHQSSSH